MIIGGLFDAPHTNPAVAAILLQHTGPGLKSLRQFRFQLLQILDALDVASERKIAGLEQDVLGPQLEDGVGMSADDRAALGNPTQHRIESISPAAAFEDRKSTRLNSSHANISYAVFCLKKKTK